jgi:rfaE bifunctional protein kinase chain/domain
MDQASRSMVSHKIKTVEELCREIGPRPRARKVIMCHGTFDVVHPGHIRHLLYAKTKADILIASLTADAHISKANLRPYVPQDLRAINLAALQAVDYVVIDPNPTPLANLARIQPDYFAKGYEYQEGGLNPKTQDEIDVLEGYGGEVLFTPGDIVYSSSRIIDTGPPNIRIEKLLATMDGEGLTFDDLRQTLERLKGLKVHVLGDTIVDTLTETSMIGGMTKTPTISVRFEKKVDFVGGAGIVAKHLQAAGAEVTFSTVLGNDAYKDFVLADLEKAGVRTLAVIDQTRPTTNKNAIISGGYRLLKVDTLDNRSIAEKILHQLQKQISESPADIVVFSDFRHGIFNRHTIPPLVAAIPDGTFRVADSQVASRWGNITEFQGFDLITPNEREARFSLGDQDSVVRPLATELHKRAHCKTLILKLGERGILAYRTRPEKDDPRTVVAVDSFADQVLDAVGAGDALLSYASLAMVASGGNEVIAAILGNMAAGIECELDGNMPVTPIAVLKKIEAAEALARYERIS